jgi:hypothetical protein
MFSEKKVHARSCLWGYGVLIFLILMESMAGCSSRAPELDKLYSSEEGAQESATDKAASLAPAELSTPPPTADTVNIIPNSSYSPMDRAVILQYAEKGESDSANLN